MPTHRHNNTPNNHNSGHTQIPAAPAEATWRHNRQPDQPIISSDSPARKIGPKVGKRVELARYTVRRGGERILYGQRVDGHVRFLPGSDGVVDQLRSRSEDATCRFRQASRGGERPNALRDKRLNADARLPTGGEAS